MGSVKADERLGLFLGGGLKGKSSGRKGRLTCGIGSEVRLRGSGERTWRDSALDELSGGDIRR
jgi:hypothetical protein